MPAAPFLKPLFHRSSPAAADTVQPELTTLPTASLNQELPIEVMRDFDTVLLFGRLAQASPSHLGVERIQDGKCFPLLGNGSIVLVRGYDARMNPVILRAVVVKSDESWCCVKDLERIYYKTGRKLVRCPVCPPSPIHVSKDEPPEQLQPCQLLNISAGGACIVSEQFYTKEQLLRIHIGLAEDSAAYRCQVARAAPRWGGFFEYGLRFVHLDRAQSECLAQEIQTIQAETRKKLLV